MQHEALALQLEKAHIQKCIPSTARNKKVKNQVLTDTKGEIDGNAEIVGDFNTALTAIDMFSREKISEATEILNDTIEQLDLIDSYRTLH